LQLRFGGGGGGRGGTANVKSKNPHLTGGESVTWAQVGDSGYRVKAPKHDDTPWDLAVAFFGQTEQQSHFSVPNLIIHSI